MNKIFKNENSFLGKIEKLFWKIYSIESMRFLFWGGINTLFTYILTQIIKYGIFDPLSWNETPFFSSSSSTLLIEIGNKFNLPYIIAFVISIPFSYTTNALFAFKQEWKLVRLARYPLSSIPNFILNLLGIWLFYIILGWPYFLATLLAAVLPLPVMFFVNKALVSPIKKYAKKEENNQKEDKKEEK